MITRIKLFFSTICHWLRLAVPAIILLMVLSPSGLNAQTTSIPDENFERALIAQGIDTSGLDGMVVTADINKLTSLNIINASIDSLSGIEDFEMLTALNCSNNNIGFLDISSNINIENLNISSNQLESLTLSANLRLKELVCSSNSLDTLVLSDNDSLTVLDCSSNRLTLLDISNDTLLSRIICHSNQLEDLTIFSRSSLSYLDCSGNRISTIDVSQNTNLETLLCSNNQLDDLDVTQNDSLSFLDCSKNLIMDLDIHSNLYLNNLSCSHNQLSNLDLVFAFDSLEVLSCSYNQIQALSLTNLVELKSLDCASNQLAGLNLGTVPLLEFLDCSGNLLSAINMGLNPSLSAINISSNIISSLDLSANLSIESLNCSDNQLADLDISNGENDSISLFNSIQNPALRCIIVDDVAEANSYIGWSKDNTALYRLVCIAGTNIPDPHFEQFLIDAGYDDTDPAGLRDGFVFTESIDTITVLDLSSTLDTLIISDLKGIEDFTLLEVLICANNDIDYLDVYQNTNLVEIDCSNNTNLNYLDVKWCSALDILNCSSCDLENLIVSNNLIIHLDSLVATSNPNLSFIQVNNVDTARADSVALKWQCDISTYYCDSCSFATTYIPDDRFEQYLIDNRYDLGPLDNFVLTSSIDTITELVISNQSITDLTGIDDFLSLERLDCSANNLTSISLDSLALLEELDCTSNFLSDLDLLANVALVSLKCGDNKLDSLIIDTLHIALDTLYCDGNKLTQLVVPSEVSLVYLVCNSNSIKDLDIGDKSELKLFHLSKNYIKSFNIGDYTMLEDLACTENLITDLDLTIGHASLMRLDCSSNYISELAAVNLSKLEKLNCSSNNIATINIDAITSVSLDTLVCDNNRLENLDGVILDGLKVLSVSSNKIEELDVINLEFLVELSCNDNFLETLVTTGMDALTFLACNDNMLEELDLSGNHNLQRLYCANNQLELLELNNASPLIELSASNNNLDILDLSTFTSLASISVDDNLLGELDLELNTSLLSLSCSGNTIAELDLSSNVLLNSLNATSNQLISLNIKNGNNTNLLNMVVLNNPYLYCIQVDDINFASNNSNWRKDSVAVYTLNCHFNETYIPDINFEQYLIDEDIDNTDPMDVADNYVSTPDISSLIKLYISNKGISDLSGIEDFASLETLDCSSNTIDSLDLSSNLALTNLNASANLLDSLDLSANINIDTLDLSDNPFIELLLDSLIALKSLTLNSTGLVDLDLSGNALLSYLSCQDIGLLSIDLRNGNNTTLETLDLRANPNLICIEVDDVDYASNAVGWIKDAVASYSLDCHYYETYVPDDNFEQFLIDRGYDYSYGELPDDYIPTASISSLTGLSIVNRNIADITGIGDFDSLRTLNCSDNQLSFIDLANNTLLEELDCSENDLTTIDITANPMLISLNVSANLLSDSIDFRSNTMLTELDCSANSLTDLYIGETPNLISLICNSNNLWRVDARNSNNHLLAVFDISFNPNLTCVLVDDPVAADTYPGWVKDTWSVYRTECTDNDNDGVPNLADSCKYTPFGDVVDLFGCSLFLLPFDNFTILKTDEICINENNGIIDITAEELHNYTAILTGNGDSRSYYFTNGIEIRNVWSGTYELCISVDNKPTSEKCFEIIINEPEDLAVLSSINLSTETVSLQMDGGSQYTVNLNGTIINTSDSSIELMLEKGENTLRVIANNECQGIYEEIIFVSDDVVFYPNPFDNYFYVYTGTKGPKEFTLSVYSIMGKLMKTEIHSLQNNPVRIDASALPSGIYIVTINSESGQSKFEIIKK